MTTAETQQRTFCLLRIIPKMGGILWHSSIQKLKMNWKSCYAQLLESKYRSNYEVYLFYAGKILSINKLYYMILLLDQSIKKFLNGYFTFYCSFTTLNSRVFSCILYLLLSQLFIIVLRCTRLIKNKERHNIMWG